MSLRRIALVGAALLLAETSALAETCKVENVGSPDQWRFVHVFDADREEIVLRQAIKGGESKSVTVSGERVRVDYKFPGGARYQTGTIAVCKGGNTVKF